MRHGPEFHLSWLPVSMLYMTVDRPGRPRFLVAAVWASLAPCACGGPSAGSTGGEVAKPGDDASATRSATDAVSDSSAPDAGKDAQAASHPLIMAVDPPFSASSPLYANWIAHEKPNVSGVTLTYPWNQIEMSMGAYDFADLDSRITSASFSGLPVAVVFEPQGFFANTATPEYVLSQVPSPDIVACTQLGQADSNLVPPWLTVYEMAWGNLIAAAVQHYNAAGSPKLAYARFGMFQGGQVSLSCVSELEALAGSYTALTTEWHDAYASLVHAIAAASPTFPVQINNACGPTSTGNPDQDCADYSDWQASLNVSHDYGIGSVGFQNSDATCTALPCQSTGDWVGHFSEYGEDSILRLLQPLDSAQNITVLIPFGVAHRANVIELELTYVRCAFDPGGDSSCPAGSSSWAGVIRAAQGI
jgi:hypothetical protein